MVTHRGRKHDAVFRAIADPTRREILGLLRGGRLSVNEIAGNFHTSRPAISRHLRTLRTAGLVKTRQDGTTRMCELSAKPLRAIDAWLRDYQVFWAQRMDDLEDLLKRMEQ
jgi:DNA-binding transcriptional ArsR family regulator